MQLGNLQTNTTRSFSFSNEVERVQRKQFTRDLVIMSAATLFALYAFGIALYIFS